MLIWAALAAFGFTLVCTPWNVSDFSGIPSSAQIERKEFSPFWEAPKNQMGRSEIDVRTLFVEWVGIGVMYWGVSAVLKKPEKPAAPQTPARR